MATGANVLGIDWRFPLADARRLLPCAVGLQGNLAPALLGNAAPEAVASGTSRLLEVMRGRNGYIFNLGHGVPPEARLENIAALVETVRGFKMSTLKVDLDLVQKYNVAGPRYTSYPPATKFTDTISWDELAAKIDGNNRAARDSRFIFTSRFAKHSAGSAVAPPSSPSITTRAGITLTISAAKSPRSRRA